MTSPTQRSLGLLRQQGFLCAVVESWVPRLLIRRDLFGVADVLAVHPRDRLFLLVQTTTAAHLAHRLAKARARPELATWLRAGGRFEVWGWARRGRRWAVKIVAVRAQDLQPVVLAAPGRRGRRPHQPGLFN
jgi:hypothetical protein